MNIARKRDAFTLIEIVIALTLGISILAVATTMIQKYMKNAAISTTRQTMLNIQQQLVLYKLNMNRYPTSREGLQALIVPPQPRGGWAGPYLSEKELNDSWTNPIEYRTGNEIENKEYKYYELYSPGDRKGGISISIGE